MRAGVAFANANASRAKHYAALAGVSNRAVFAQANTGRLRNTTLRKPVRAGVAFANANASSISRVRTLAHRNFCVRLKLAVVCAHRRSETIFFYELSLQIFQTKKLDFTFLNNSHQKRQFLIAYILYIYVSDI